MMKLFIFLCYGRVAQKFNLTHFFVTSYKYCTGDHTEFYRSMRYTRFNWVRLYLVYYKGIKNYVLNILYNFFEESIFISFVNDLHLILIKLV